MSSTVREPRGRKPENTLVKRGVRRKRTRNWGAGLIAASVAVAWTIGGLVLPSMAAEPTAVGSVHPDVKLSDIGRAHVSLVSQPGNLLYAAVPAKNLISTVNGRYARMLYGRRQQFGDFTAQYLPKSCIVRDDGQFQEYLEDFIVEDGHKKQYEGNRYGAWVLYPNAPKSISLDRSASDSSDRSAAPSDRSADNPDNSEDATSDTLTLTPDFSEFEFNASPSGAAGSTLDTGKVDTSKLTTTQEKTVTGKTAGEPANGERAADSAASAAQNADKSATTPRTSRVERGATQAKDVKDPQGSPSADSSSTELAKPTPAQTGSSEPKTGTDSSRSVSPEPSSQPAPEKSAQGETPKPGKTPGKVGKPDKTPKTFMDRSAVDGENEGGAQPGKTGDAQDRAMVFSAFHPNVSSLNVKYDPNKKKSDAISEMSQQVDSLQENALRQFDEFVRTHQLPAAVADTFRTKLNMQFEAMRQKATEFLEKKYASNTQVHNGPVNPETCERSGPIVPDGTFVLVNADKSGDRNWGVYMVGVLRNGHIERTFQYSDDGGKGTIKADGLDSFCVDPLTALHDGIQEVRTFPSTVEWAKHNPERAKIVKALAWRYKQLGDPKKYASYQNAIWATVLGMPVSVGTWDRMLRDWVTDPGAAAGLVSEAVEAYNKRPSLVHALETMHLDEVSVDTASDGKSKVLFLQLNDYTKDQNVRSAIGNNVYLQVRGATDTSGKPVNRISLEQAEGGVHLVVKDPAQFDISFVGSLRNAEDAYFLEGVDTQAQVTVLSQRINVSGSLKVEWGNLNPSEPAVETAVLVNGSETNPGGAETLDLSQYQNNATITLSDRVSYRGLAKFATTKDNYYLVGKLMRARQGRVEEIYTGTQDVKDIPSGGFDSIFPVTLKASDLQANDHYYYEEYITTTNSHYNRNQQVNTYYGPMHVVVAHQGENPDQTVKVKGSNAKLLINKIGAGESAKAKGNVSFDVYCKKDNKPTTMSRLYAPAAGGSASTNGVEPATELVVVPGSNCQVTETYSSQDVTFTDKDAVSFKAAVLGNQQQQIPAPARTTVDQDGHRLRAVTSFDVPQGATQVTLNTVNTYKPDNTAKFTLRKVVHASDGASLEGTYRFTVTCGDQKDSLNLWRQNNYQYEFSQLKGKKLEAGTRCTVEEVSWQTGARHDWKSVDYQVSGAGNVSQEVNRHAVSFTLQAASQGETVVTATNNYDLKKGTLRLHKQVKVDGKPVGNQAKDNPWKDKTYDFSVDCATPKADQPQTASAAAVHRNQLGAGEAWKAHVGIKADQDVVLKRDNGQPFDAGTLCFVWENTSGDSEVTSNVSWAGGDSATYTDGAGKVHENARRVAIAPDSNGNPGVTLNAVNNLKVNYGSFKLRKELTGDDYAVKKAQNTEFKFDVTCEGLEKQTVKVRPNHTVDFTQSTGKKVKTGATCQVLEQPANIKGLSVQLTGWKGNGLQEDSNHQATFRVPGADVTDLVFTATNHVTVDTAKFKIHKIVNPAGTEFNGNFKFTYNCVDSDQNTYTQAKPYGTQPQASFVEVPAGQESDEITVPANSKCHVTEVKDQLPTVKDNATKNPLNYSVLTFDPAGKGQQSGQFTPAKDTVVTVSATNTYVEKMTGFKFTKKITGNNKANHASDTFEFGYSCQARNGKVFAGSAKLGDNGDHSVEKLPVGTKCVLWENPAKLKTGEKTATKWNVTGKTTPAREVRDFAKNAKTHANGIEFGVETENKPVVIETDNSFDLPATSLTVSKKVVADKLSTVPKDQRFNVKVSCVYPTDNQTHDLGSVNLADGKSHTFKADAARVPLPLGASCTVTEDSASAAVDGHNWNVKIKDGKQVLSSTATAKNITLPSKGLTVTVENHYQRKVGGFRLTKKLLGDGLDQNVALQANGGKYDFTYKCTTANAKTGKPADVSGSFSVAAPQLSHEVTGIPAGANCVVTEKPAKSPLGYAAAQLGWKVAGTDAASGTVTVQEGKTVDLEATNTYKPYNVKFDLDKVAVAEGNAKLDGDFRFHLKCGNQEDNVTLNSANGYHWTFDHVKNLAHLSGQTCTITEIGTQDLPSYNWKSLRYDVSGVSAVENSQAKSVSFTLPTNGDATVKVTATNTYQHKKGVIYLEKDVKLVNTNTNPWPNKEYVFDIDCWEQNPNGTYSKTLWVPAHMHAGEKKQAVDSPKAFGTVCYVWERNNNNTTPQVENTLTWEGDGEPASYTDGNGLRHDDARKVVIDSSKHEITVKAVNNLRVRYGAFSLTKKLTGDAAGDDKVKNTDFKFNVKCDGLPDQSVTLKGGETKPVPSDRMKVGSKCTVHEVPTAIPGVSSTLNWEGDGLRLVDNNGIEVTVPEEGVANVTFTADNQVNYDKAKFTIRKDVIPASATFNGNFKFTYNCVAPDGKTFTQAAPFMGQLGSAYVEVAAGTKSGEITVPAGSVCQVTEADPSLSPQVTDQDGANPLKYVSTKFATPGASASNTGTTSAKVTVSKDQVVEFGATNTYVEKTNGFQFSKVVSGNNAGNHQEQFAFGYSCQSRNGKITSGSVKLGDKGSYQVKDIPVGTKCVLWEDAAKKLANEKSSTKWTVNGEEKKAATLTDAAKHTHANAISFAVKTEKDAINITAENKFEVPGTTLTVSKKVVADKLSDIPQGQTFPVNVECVYPTDKVTHTIASHLALQAGKSHTFKTDAAGVAIPVGASCTVTEEATSANVPGHNWSVKLKDGETTLAETNSARVELPAAGKTLTVENHYTRQVGGFTLTKRALGEGLDANTALQANGGKFDFAYECTLNGKPVKQGKLSLKATRMSVTISDVPAGARCAVSETPAKAPRGYTVPKLSWKLDGADIPDGSVTIAEKQTPMLEATNTYTPYQVKFDLKKFVKADDQADLSGDYTFQVSCGEVSQTVTLNNANGYAWDSAQLTGAKVLSGETCTIQETNPAQFATHNWKSVDYTVNGQNVKAKQNAGAKSVSFTLPATGNATVKVTATNNYQRKLGSLRLVKTVALSNATSNPWKDKTYNFSAQCYEPGASAAELGAAMAPVNLDLKAGSKPQTVLSKAKSGTTCFIRENVENTDDVTNILNWSGAGTTVNAPDGTGNVRKVVIGEDQPGSEPATVTAANTLQVRYGTFSLAKKLTGDAAGYKPVQDTGFTFNVKCDGLPDQSVTLKGGETKTLPGNLMKVGSKCTVHEAPATISGVTTRLAAWEGNTPASANGDVTVTVPAEGVNNVTFTAVNEVTYDKASFKITKTVDPAATAFDAAFNFTYNCVAPDKTVYTQATPFAGKPGEIKLQAGQTSDPVVVPAGSHCQVSEVDPANSPKVKDNATQNPVKYDSTVFNPGGKGLTSGVFSPAKDTMVEVSAKNVYVEKMTGFQFTKTVTGDNKASHAGQEYSFGYTCKAPNGDVHPGSAKLTENSEAAKAEKLPLGTECVLWEDAVKPQSTEKKPLTTWTVDKVSYLGKQVTDHRGSTHDNGVTFKVNTEGTPVVVNAENKFDLRDVTVTVSKKVVKHAHAVVPAEKTFKLSLSCVYPTDNATHTIAAGVEFGNDTTKTFDADTTGAKIPVGAKCSVSEDESSAQLPGHAWKMEVKDTNQVLAKGLGTDLAKNRVEVVNTYDRKTGGFKLSKTVAAGLDFATAAQANGGKFDFAYDCTLDGASVKHGVVSLDSAKAQPEVKEVPQGAQCTLTEKKVTPPTGYASPVLSWKVDGVDTGGVVTIKENQTAKVVATNTYTPYQVKFTLKKLVKTNDQATLNGDYKFQVTCGDKTQPVVLNSANHYQWDSKDFKELKVLSGEKCAIQETNPAQFATHNWKSVQYQVTGVEATSEATNSVENGVSFTLPKTGDATVEVGATNTYQHKVGTVRLQKTLTVTNAKDNPWKDKSYKFQASCYEPDAKGAPGKQVKSFTLEVKPGQDPQTVVENVKTGTICYLNEDVQNTPDVSDTLTWGGEGETAVSPEGQANARKVVVTDKEGGLTLTAANSLKVNYGTFSLAKKLTGDAAGHEKVKHTDFKFNVKCDGLPDQSVTLKGGETKALPGNLMKVGSKCTVHEAPANIPGVTTRLAAWNDGAVRTADGGIEVTVPAKGALTFTATNEVTYKKASFKIRKVVTAPGQDVSFNGNFKFTYKCVDPDGKTFTQDKPFLDQPGSAYVEVASGQTSNQITVPQGSRCQVSEVKPGDLSPISADPMKYSSTSFTVGSQTVPGDTSAEFSVDAQVTATATNTYVGRMTGFQFAKTLAGNNSSKHASDQFSFGYACRTPKGDLRTGATTLQANGQIAEVKNLPLGSECSLWENPVQPGQNEKLVTNWTVGKNGSVAGTQLNDPKGDVHSNGVTFKVETEGTPVVINVENKFDIPGSTLRVNKQVLTKGEDTKVPSAKKFKVDVTCKYPTDGENHVIAKGLALTNGQTQEFKTDTRQVDIPVGASCTITEDPASAKLSGHNWSVKLQDGQTTLSETNSGTVETTLNEKTVNILNTYERNYGTFQITKMVTGDSYIKTKPTYEFAYTCTDPAHKDAREFTHKLSVGGGETQTSERIPVGYVCQVKEANPGVAAAKWTSTLSQNKFTISDIKKQNVTVSATNNFTDVTGKFKVKKLVHRPADASGFPQNGVYNFEWWCGAPGAAAPGQWNKFTLRENQEYTSPAVPSGSVCGIRELKPADDFTGFDGDVTWKLQESVTNPEADSVAAPVMVDTKDAFVFGQSGDTAGKFTIGTNGTVRELVATNTFKHSDVELNLRKVAKFTDADGKETGADPAGLLKSNQVKMRVTCGGKDYGTYDVPVDGTVVPVNGKVPFGTECTVSELKESFNQDANWHHTVDWMPANSVGDSLTAQSVKPGQDEVSATKVKVEDKTAVTLTATNKWNQVRVETVLAAATQQHADLTAPLTLQVSNDPNAEVKLVDTVSVTGAQQEYGQGSYTVVGRLFDVSQAGQLNVDNFDTTPSLAQATDSMSPTAKTVTLNYTLTGSELEKHPNGIAAAVVVYRNCEVVGHELTLPPSQQVKPTWKGELKTQVRNPATNSNMLKVGKEATDQKVTDTVTYTNVTPGSYDLYARIVALGNDNLTIGEGTTPVTTAKPGDNTLSSGVWDNNLTVTKAKLEDAVTSGNSKFVTYEFLLPKDSATSGVDVGTLTSRALASHVDRSDLKQQLFTPTLKTNATVGQAGTKTVGGEAKGEVSVYDRVQYVNLQGGKKYTVSGTLHVKNPDGTDGGVLEGVSPVTQSIDLSAKAKDQGFSGEVTVKFTLDAQKVRNLTLVAFEEVHDGDLTVAAHTDIDDADQTVYSPKLATSVSANPGTKAEPGTPAVVDMSNAKALKGKDSKKSELGGVKFTDKVEYNSLEPGVSYTLYGELRKVVNGKAVSTVATASKSFSVDALAAVHGFKDVEFPGVKVQSGSQYVVFEYLFKTSDYSAKDPETGKALAHHTDATDQLQTVMVPGLSTSATNDQGGKYVDSTKDFTVNDTVTATGLTPGKTYDVSGELMVADVPEGTPTGITQSGTLTADPQGSGETTLSFKVSAAEAQRLDLAGKPLVAFEDLSMGGSKLAVHRDINDASQTVYNGGMKTMARDAADSNQTMTPGQKNAKVVDTVTFNGRFEKAHSYILQGKLHYVTADGKDGGLVPGAKAEDKPVKSGSDGQIKEQTMTFTVPSGSIVAGKNMVVFEKLVEAKDSGKTVVAHEDPNDKDQTITVNKVEIKTTAYNGAAGDKSKPTDKLLTVGPGDETVTVYDRVDYQGLNVGESYTVTGALHYQADATLADGTQVHAGDVVDAKYVKSEPVLFTAKTVNSTDQGASPVVVKFEVQKAALATAPVVVFEKLLQGEVEVASHENIADASQTVHVYKPEVHTTATIEGQKVFQLPENNAKKALKTLTVKDEVAWSNLAPGSYIVVGRVMAARAGQLTSSDPITNAKAEFSVKKGEASGVAHVEFKIPVGQVKAGGDFVVYEQVKDVSGKLVASHEVPNDVDQTVTVGSLTTKAKDQGDGDRFVDNTRDVTIVDEVTYSGLNPQKNYTLKGELMDKATKASTGITSSINVGSGTGHAIDPSGAGKFELPFTVRANQILGKTVVAFETLSQDGQEFLVHQDIDDEDQTVYAPQVATQARADGDGNRVLADADSTVWDTVTLSGLKAGEKYVLTGTLVRKTIDAKGQVSATPVLGKGMQSVTGVSKEFTGKSGQFTLKDAVKFSVPAGTVEPGVQLVVYEKLALAADPSKPLASHEDPNDTNQTVNTGKTPVIKTVLSADGRRQWDAVPVVPSVPLAATGLVDTVLHEGLVPGTEYRLDAELMEVSPVTGDLTSKTPVATGSQTFTPTATDGSVSVPINLGNTKLKAGYKYVAYETLTRVAKPGSGEGNGADKPVKHEDPKDENQTVLGEHHPGITTVLSDTQAAKGTDGKVISVTKDAKLKDVVHFTQTGLVEGAKYYVFSNLVNQANPNQVLASQLQEFTAKGDQLKSVTANFTLPKETLQELAGSDPSAESKLVAYEYLALASDVQTTDKTAQSPADAVKFKDGKAWAATHADPNDADQTVTVVSKPKLGTTLKYGDSKVVYVADKAVLTDTVEYFNLQPNTEYQVSGKLMGAKEPVQVDENENPVLEDTGVVSDTNSGKFTTPAAKSGAHTVSGQVKVTFTVPRDVLEANDRLVAYEHLTVKGQPVYEPDGTTPVQHEDPKDENQTVSVKHPGVGTVATVDDGETKGLKAFDVSAKGRDTITINDAVRLYNVEVGKTYAVAGQVYDQRFVGETGTKPLAKAATTLKVTPEMKRDATWFEKAKYGQDVKVYQTTVKLDVNRADLTRGALLTDDVNMVVFEQLWAPGTGKVNQENGEVTAIGGAKAAAEHNDPQSSSQMVTAEPQFGSLTLTKAVHGWEDTLAQVPREQAVYQFTVKCDHKQNMGSISLHEGESYTVEGIPLGDACTIKEDVQNAVDQSGLKDTVKFTEANGLTVTSTENGVARVTVGGSPDGQSVVANATVSADNVFSYDPVITTNTTGMFGKTFTNGETLTDHVTYKQVPAGKYMLHAYFVEMVKNEKTGQVEPQKIAYLPSYTTPVSAGSSDQSTPQSHVSAEGYSGTWDVNVKVPDQLAETNKQVVMWEDLYLAPSKEAEAKFNASLQGLKTGEFSKVAKLVASHHETSAEQGEGYQWLQVSSNYGSFQVEKDVKLGDGLDPNTVKQLPKSFRFNYEAKLPEGKTLQDGAKAKGDFTLTVDPHNPSLAYSPVFKGFPVGTVVTVSETGAQGDIPTGAAMTTTWSLNSGGSKPAWTNGVAKASINVAITPSGLTRVKAVNRFDATHPSLATVATVADEGAGNGGKLLGSLTDTKVMDTVTYSDLAPNRDYWLLTQLAYTDDSSPVVGTDDQPLQRWTRVTSGKDGSGKWVVDAKNPLVVPAGSDPNRDVVFFESLYAVPAANGNGDTAQPNPGVDQPIVEHKNPGDAKQILTRRPVLDLQTVASVDDQSGNVEAGSPATVTDTVSYNGLRAGDTYSLLARVVSKDTGKTVSEVVKSGLVAEANGSGKWMMTLPLSVDQTKDLPDGTKLVVFERVFAGSLKANTGLNVGVKPLLAHEDLNDVSQTLEVVAPTGPGLIPPTPPVSPSTSSSTSTPSTPPSPPVSPSTTTPSSPSTVITPPVPPVAPANTIPPAQAKIPPTLARTGAQVAIAGILALVMICGGAAVGLLAAKRKRDSAERES